MWIKSRRMRRLLDIWTIGVLALGSLLLCFSQGSPLANSLASYPETYHLNGHLCNKCRPGTYLFSDCTDNEDTICKPCRHNEYSSEWNIDSQCSLQAQCDYGKGLVELYSGNTTSPRECICKEGYYFDRSFDFCKETSTCPPEFGVLLPVEQNKDTKCTPCPVGFFSSSKSKDACTAWTDCISLGLKVTVAGTNRSDVICDKASVPSAYTLLILGIVISAVVLIIAVICAMFVFKWNQLRNVKENFQRCSNIFNRTQADERARICSNSNVIPSPTTGCETDCTQIPKNLQQVNHKTTELGPVETDHLLCRSVPTEDEYTDKHFLPTESEIVIAGSESMTDSGDSLGINGLQNDAQGKSFSSSQQGQNNPLHVCGQGSRPCFMNLGDDSENATTESLGSVCSRCSSQYTSGTYSSQRANHKPLSDFGEEAGLHANKRQCPKCHKSIPESSPTTELPPPLAGNVTGDNNTTVISNGSVMNITAEFIVLVVSSQDQPTTTENSNMGSPVEEETQGQCDTLVVNTELFSGRYNDFQSSSECQISVPDSSMRTDMPEMGNLQWRDLGGLPIQEEGKAKCDEPISL